MARRPSDKQVILQERLTSGSASAVADFLRANATQMADFTNLTPEQVGELANALKSRQRHLSDAARDFLDEALESPQHLPVRNIHLTKLVRRALAERESERTHEFLRQKRYLRATINSWGSIMTAWGLNETKRNAVAAGFFSPFLISFAMNAALTDDTQAARHAPDIQPEPAAHHETLTMEDLLSERFQPGNPATGALGYAPVPTFSHPAFDNFTTPPSPLAAAFNPETVAGLQLHENGTIQYRDWAVPQEVYEANARTSLMTGFPPDLLYAIHAAESSFVMDNLNEQSDACGLGQFVPSTFYEKIFNYGDLAGYPETTDLVERYVAARDDQKRPIFGFRPSNAQAETTLASLCFDPDLNSRLTAIYATRTIGSMQRNLQDLAPEGAAYFPLTAGQYYTAYFSGQNRAERMIRNLAEEGGTRDAHMFFDRDATLKNMNILFVDGDRAQPRSVAEFFDYMTEYKGLGAETLPDMRNWEGRRSAMASAIRQDKVIHIATGSQAVRPNSL